MITRLAASSAGDFKAAIHLSKYTAELTAEKAMNAPGVQLSVIRRHDEATYYKTVTLLLTRAIELLNATNTLTNTQIADCCARIAKTFYFLKIDEILYVIQKATEGYYGKDFNRIDAGVVMEWIRSYDVSERTPIVTSIATEPVEVEKKPVLDDEGLKNFYEVDAKHNNPMPAPVKDNRLNSDRQQQAEARARYLTEKSKGVVKTYTADDLLREAGRETVAEFERTKDTVQRLVDTEYVDVTAQN